MHYSPRVQAVLKQFGWSPERRVPTIQWEDQLVADGYWVSPTFLEIASNLGGLRITPDRAPRDRYRLDTIFFEPDRGIGLCCDVRPFELAIHSRLTPIGEVGDGQVLLLCAEDKRVFGLWSGDLAIYFGDDLCDAFERTLLFAESPLRRWRLTPDGRLEDGDFL